MGFNDTTTAPRLQIAREAMSTAESLIALLLLVLAVVAVVYVSSTQSASDQLSTQSQQISTLESEVQELAGRVGQGISGANLTLPVMNQAPTIRTIRETWYLSTSAHQDRFDPTFIVVNQGDAVRLTLIDNDTVAHDFVIGPPYNVIVNATVPGLVNDLTGQTFTTPSRNNSPGVTVSGTPGNVSASFFFVAAYSGIFEFVCTYHAQVGMIGYLVVLPNAGYEHPTSSTSAASTSVGSAVDVSITSGAAIPPNKGFAPDNITVVMGENNTVTWTNNDSNIHTVTSTAVPPGAAPFDSGYLNQGQTFTYTFTVAGKYAYHCQLHPWMTGTVTVIAG
jgi:plastocyanin